MNWILVFVGGGLGSMTRYGFGLWLTRTNWPNFPLATFLSNLVACAILGILVFALRDKVGQNPWMLPLLGIGFCGGFSTFSTFSLEVVQLISSGFWGWALLNIALSLLCGIGLIFLLRAAF